MYSKTLPVRVLVPLLLVTGLSQNLVAQRAWYGEIGAGAMTSQSKSSANVAGTFDIGRAIGKYEAGVGILAWAGHAGMAFGPFAQRVVQLPVRLSAGVGLLYVSGLAGLAPEVVGDALLGATHAFSGGIRAAAVFAHGGEIGYVEALFRVRM